MEDFGQESKYQRARERVEELKKFYGNITSYAFHAAKTFRWNPFFSRDWEERKIKEFMEEDKKQGSRWE